MTVATRDCTGAISVATFGTSAIAALDSKVAIRPMQGMARTGRSFWCMGFSLVGYVTAIHYLICYNIANRML